MPELPEVETTVRAIKNFEGSDLKKIIIHNPNLRWRVDPKIEQIIRDKFIKTISRRAKYIIITFDTKYLIIHLGMSGKLRIQKAKDNFFKKHDHAEFIFKDLKIIYNDPRRFGSIHLIDDINSHFLLSSLGVEPLSRSFNKEYLYSLSKTSNLNIKKLIMDQKKVVGVGNIYASESLFLAKVKPTKISRSINLDECAAIVSSIKKILKYAIKMGGTTLNDFYSADGSEGYFKLKLKVYGREDKPCKSCSEAIKKINIGQRATYYCSKCQS